MKKIISVILSAVMLICTLTAGASAAQEKPTCFAVAADLHYTEPSPVLERNIDDPVFWYSNRRAAMEDHSGFIIDEFLRQCAEDDACEFILLPGDLSNEGRNIAEQHLDVAAKLRRFEKETGKHVYVINGNHDAGGEGSVTRLGDFKKIYWEFGYDEALYVSADNCSYTANLGEKYRLIALDSCNENKSTEDGMNAEKIKWVLDEAAKAKKDGRYPILMMHHNLLDHLPAQRILSRNFIVRFHFTTAELFADSGIKLVFTGHEHCSDAASYTSALGNKIYDFATTSLTMYPLEYRMFSMEDSEISYEARKIEKINTDALTAGVKGFTSNDVDMMNNDFQAYSKGFFKAGVRFRLESSLSPEEMDINKDAVYYNVASAALNGLTGLLAMPINGKGGLRELAGEYGLDIPESNYENAWDLITDLAGMHYEGSENYSLDSVPVQTLLKAIVTVLRADFANAADALYLVSFANSLLEDYGISSVSDELTKLGIKLFGAVTPVEYFLLAVASPVIYKFANDDEVDDNNGTIEGYATASPCGSIVNIGANISEISKKVVFYLNTVAGYLLKAVCAAIPLK